MQVVAIIPARYGSSRFPGKPLASQTGRPLIQHVVERVRQAAAIERCVVATDDRRILEAVRTFGGEAVMTRADHPSGTDRIAEAARQLGGAADDLLLNVQGDEPEIEPEALDRLVRRMREERACGCGTLACPLPDGVDPRDPNRVKVVCDQRGRALYFSRAAIPHPRDGDRPAGGADWLLHLGVYAFRRSVLLEFAQWGPTPLEQTEKLEQLRLLERGCAVAVERVAAAAAGVDTPQDYAAFVRRWHARQMVGASGASLASGQDG